MLPKIFRLEVSLRDHRVVEQLHQENAELNQRIAQLTAQFNRAEFLLICQYKVNEQLTNYCEENGFSLPKRLYQTNFEASGFGK